MFLNIPYNRIYHYDPDTTQKLDANILPIPQKICNSYLYYQDQSDWEKAIQQHSRSHPKKYCLIFSPDAVQPNCELSPNMLHLTYPGKIAIDKLHEKRYLHNLLICFWTQGECGPDISLESITEDYYFDADDFNSVIHDLKPSKWKSPEAFFQLGLWQIAHLEWLQEYERDTEAHQLFAPLWKAFIENKDGVAAEIMALSKEKTNFSHCPSLSKFWNAVCDSYQGSPWGRTYECHRIPEDEK